MSRNEEMLVLDVRSRDEWIDGHIKDSLNIYVGQLEKQIDDLPEAKQLVIVCESGTQSSLASSILLQAGRKNISNTLGVMGSWRKLGYSTKTG